MIKKRKDDVKDARYSTLGNIEIRKIRGGTVMVIGGVLSVREFNEEKITIMTRKGYVTVLGKKLVLSVFEGRFAEICGIIHNVGVGDGSL